jgi:DNA repair exonuclease SbcCD ATPase subunit
LKNPHPDYFKESPKTVYDFIRNDYEKPIYDFFMLNIDKLLEKYEPGEPKMKPDVLKQIKEIEEEREKMIKEEMAKQQANGPIMLNRPGEQPVALSNQQVVEIITQQQKQLQELVSRSGELENMVTNLQKQLIEKTKATQSLTIELNNSKKMLSDIDGLKAELNEAKKRIIDFENNKYTRIPIQEDDSDDEKPTVSVFDDFSRLKNEPEIFIKI